MPDTPECKTKECVLFILCLIGYFAVVLVPTIILGLHFPKYGLWFFIIGSAICFAGPGFKVGLEWNSVPSDAKKSVRGFCINILALLLVMSVLDMILQRTRIDKFVVGLGVTVFVALCTIITFYLGFYICKRRSEERE